VEVVTTRDDWGTPRRLGRRGPEVTGLGLGTAPIGNMFTVVGDEDGWATVDAGW
jgi:D-threo-aldose 1-dehydrogenase